MIKVTCPSCGDQLVANSHLTVVSSPVRPGAHYRFACPECGTRVVREASSDIARLLTTAGVRSEREIAPSLTGRALDEPPIGYDDLLDFALALRMDDDVIAQVVSSLR